MENAYGENRNGLWQNQTRVGSLGKTPKKRPGKDTPSPYTEKINGFLKENERTGQQGKKATREEKIKDTTQRGAV